MRRVIVEDSTDGLRLCKIITEIYSPDGEAISVESFHGMVNLKRKIEDLCAELKPTDDAIIVYDGIKENPLVLRHAEEAFGYLEASGKEDISKNFRWIQITMSGKRIWNILRRQTVKMG